MKKKKAVTLERQLLLFINLGRAIRSSPNYLKSIALQTGKLFLRGKHVRQLPIFSGVDIPAGSAQGQSVKLRQMTINPRAPSQTPQASVSRLKVMILNQCGCLEEKASSL
ncbi:hypothetical protein GOODEAATRI_021919 [Goodea atripinnis]|uniref:Uncharacterized protein n=1 Tax=Goodea atripinnis TaxID=208336 RepID=A0ABV0PQM9_9TELE